MNLRHYKDIETMHSAAIDIGNTRAKIGIFKDSELLETSIVTTQQALQEKLQQHPLREVILSSVSKEWQLPEELYKVSYLDHHTEIPIINQYDTPHSLGMDRLAGVIGAYTLYPNSSSLVIDAGTSITYDIIDSEGVYHGGGIAPGIWLRFKSLNDHTSRLPLIENIPDHVDLIGTTTETSILSGVINGVVAEIEGIIRRYHHKFPNLKVLLCGGDATFFESTLKAPIFVVPHLVLIGLNRILLHNNE